MTNSKLRYLAAVIFVAPHVNLAIALVCSGVLILGAFFSKD